jgi:Transcriptional regulator, AbiEi antitoxin
VPSAGLAGRGWDRRCVSAKRRDPRVLPVPLDVLRPLGAKRRADGLGRGELDVLRMRLVSRQQGIVGRAQLDALGFTRDEIAHDVKRGRLIRVQQGVYAVGHDALSDRGRMLAALLAAGPGAALSHRTAAYLWKLIPSMPQFPDVTLTDRAPRTRNGLRVHRAEPALGRRPRRAAASSSACCCPRRHVAGARLHGPPHHLAPGDRRDAARDRSYRPAGEPIRPDGTTHPPP